MAVWAQVDGSPSVARITSMADERRYGDAEVREIFDLASRAGETPDPGSVDRTGLTLIELQEVGREVGLEPARIAEAAAALTRTVEVLPPRMMLGRPVSVGRVVELPRAPTDFEWDLLVAEFRTTFGAQGEVSSSGGLRDWSNGNLHASIEPTESGYRLRLKTVKSTALFAKSAGTFWLVFAAFIAMLLVLQGRTEDLVIPLVFALVGAAALISPVLTLPPWAKERERQMEHIAERATTLLASGPRES